MKKTLFTAAVLAAFTFSACSENAETAETAVGENMDMEMPAEAEATTVVVETPDFSSVAEPVQNQISQLVDAYLNLKEALVASDATAAKAAASNVLEIARAMPVANLEADAKAYAEEKTAKVIETAEAIAAAEEIAAQRESLEPLSEATFALTKAFNAADQTLYYQRCPMALNNKGAYWLSSNEEIRNPYFGEQMLKCGSTEEVYQN
ncbi:uncharacterized protein DUF3347 [Pontibacter ummariensis]|uniref:DUF3347 domain-containing protein n=1 Tax=Pontibacter ummariensis TaxID=1610492 RepID=A0A239ITK2_9BACT|nr:DUF3347 domain-containing protein [Pontibacter ummariensis]PRY09672.1 uncharacterized protein DUF3347 [Pontibacter ummariensis]SNS96363.1 Protein of unknown function [Pontibacter ummariensis]